MTDASAPEALRTMVAVGAVPPTSVRIWARTDRPGPHCLVIATGDQVYADFPAPRSLYDAAYFATVGPACRGSILECSRDEVRAIYQQRYRQAWAIPELQQIYADVACWPILDDHEIVNNFGSLEDHASPAWACVRGGALDAFFDYQGSRVFAARPPTFDHGFRYAGIACYQLDIRSERRADGHRTQILAPAQHAALADFLRAHADARVLFLTVPVPIAYVPTWLAALADVVTPDHDGADRWSHANALADRDQLLGTLLDHAHAYPEQQLVLLSGDVHVGMAFELRWQHGPVFYQLTSSALTNVNGPLASALYTLAPHAERTIHRGAERARVAPIPAADGSPATNPFGGLNAGIVHVEDDGTRARVRFELISVTDDARPETVYLSRWLDEA